MAEKILNTRVLQKTDLAANWKSNNPVLKAGEIGCESDTHKVKIGDGKTSWNSLSYVVSQNAETRYKEIISRGENLIINGNGFLGDNTNFSSLIFDGANANGSPGSFTQQLGKKNTYRTDDFFPITPSSTYEFTVDFKTVGKSHMYTFLGFYDVDKREITAPMHMYMPGTLTTLTQPLNNGDTVIHLANLDNWQVGSNVPNYRRSIIIWNYKNSFGYLYPEQTYSRNYHDNLYEATNSAAVNKSSKTITLKNPWAYGAVPAGTKISQGSSGGTFKYGWHGYLTDADWASYPAVYAGTDYSGGNRTGKFPPGTAYAKVGFLWNYDNNPNAQTWVTNISVREIRSQALTANKVSKPLVIQSANSDIIFDGSTQTNIAVSSSTASKVTNVGKPTNLKFTYTESSQNLSIIPEIGVAPTVSNVNVIGGISKADFTTLEEPIDYSTEGPMLEEGELCDGK